MAWVKHTTYNKANKEVTNNHNSPLCLCKKLVPNHFILNNSGPRIHSKISVKSNKCFDIVPGL